MKESARFDSAWINRAMSSLPVPCSPTRRTGTGDEAARAAIAIACLTWSVGSVLSQRVLRRGHFLGRSAGGGFLRGRLTGEPMLDRGFSRAVERNLVRLGVRAGIYDLYPHRLRRTYAVQYLRALKGDPEALMKLTQHMQWASMATAMEYVDHARGDELDAAAYKLFDRDAPADDDDADAE